jgi:hypothetical protein
MKVRSICRNFRIGAISTLFYVGACGSAGKTKDTNPPSLAGIWSGECVALESDTSRFRKLTYEGSPSSLTIIESVFNKDSTCAAADSNLYELRLESSYATGSEQETVGIYDLDVAITGVFFVMRSELLANQFSQLTYCGKGDWAVGQDVDVSPLTSSETCPIAEPGSLKGSQIKTIYKVDGNKLYPGDNKGPKDANSRFNTLVKEPLLKQ